MLSSRSIIHVGPHKTGTTALQATLLQARAILKSEDKFSLFAAPPVFKYRGSKYAANVAFYLQTRSVGNRSQVTSPVWKHFKDYVDATWKAQRHIVVSSEEFARPTVDIPLLAGALRLFRTTIVIVHRPYVEWLVSRHSETMQQRHAQKHDVQALEDFLTEATIIDTASSSGVHTLAVYQRYRLHFDRVSVHAYSRAVVPEIICTDMQASATCTWLRSRPQIIANANKSARVSKYTKPSCMDSKRMQLLWTMTVGIEVQAREIMGQNISTSHLKSEMEQIFAESPIRECNGRAARP